MKEETIPTREETYFNLKELNLRTGASQDTISLAAMTEYSQITSAPLLAKIEELGKENKLLKRGLTDDLLSELLKTRWKEAKDQITTLQSSLTEKEKECEELKAWKESMISVMPPIQEIGKAINVKLGESIHDKILPHIESQSKRISELEEGLSDLYLSIVDKNFYNSHATALTNAKQLLK